MNFFTNKKNILLFLIPCLITISFSHDGISNNVIEFPYEECDCFNQNFTNKIINTNVSLTNEGAYCFICDELRKAKSQLNKETLSSISMAERANEIPKICFFLSSARGVNIHLPQQGKGGYFYCQNRNDINRQKRMSIKNNNNDKDKNIHARAPCLNEDYTNMIHLTFNKMADCFDFDKQGKQELFKLFNHESSFLLNSKSYTGARCIGQLTRDAVADVNLKILTSIKKNNNNNVDKNNIDIIYDNLIKKEECKELMNNKTVPKTIMESGNRYVGIRDYDMRKEALKKIPIDCPISQDVNSCLFYSMYNAKVNLESTKINLKSSVKNIGQNVEISPSMAEFIKNPINRSEILLITQKEPGKEKKQYLFQTNGSAYEFSKKHAFDKNMNLRLNFESKKINLFSKESKKNYAWMVSHFSYNGGVSVASGVLKNFMDNLKVQISDKTHIFCTAQPKKTPICVQRLKLEKGEPLDLEFLKDRFKKYLAGKYKGSMLRRKEVSNFVENVENDNRVILGISTDKDTPEEGSKFYNQAINYTNKMFCAKNKKNRKNFCDKNNNKDTYKECLAKGKKDNKIKNFLDQSLEHCSFF